MKSSRRLVALDVLRAFAILLVMGRHHLIHPPEAGHFFRLAELWYRYGWTGVDLFFVLSGFLIGGLLINEILRYDNLHVSRFWVRRGLKIWPSYYLFLAWVVYNFNQSYPGPFSAAWTQFWPRLWPSLLNVQNYLPWARWHLWSLAVEEHFYILLPLALLLFAPTKNKLMKGPLVKGLLAVLVFCLVARIVTVLKLPYSPYYDNWTHLRIDGLAFGFLLSYLYDCHPSLWKRIASHKRSLLVLGIFAIVPSGLSTTVHPYLDSIELTLLYLGYGAILMALVGSSEEDRWPWLKSAPARWLAFVGTYSYSIYLWHADTGAWVHDHLLLLHLSSPSFTWLIETIAYVAAAIGVGIAIGTLVEMPFLRLRDRLYPARATALK